MRYSKGIIYVTITLLFMVHGFGEVLQWETEVHKLKCTVRNECYIVTGPAGHRVDHGAYTATYPNGRLAIQGQRFENDKVGEWKGWFPNGNPEYIEHYENDKRNGLCVYYYENGVKRTEAMWKDDRYHGKYVSWYDNGQVERQGAYDHGERCGHWRGWGREGNEHAPWDCPPCSFGDVWEEEPRKPGITIAVEAEKSRLKTTPHKPHTTKVIITAMEETKDNGNIIEKPAGNIEIALEEPEYGMLSALQVTTNSSGRAEVTYTSPGDELFAQSGKAELTVYVRATEQKTHHQDYAVIIIESQKKTIELVNEHTIIPGYSHYYSRVQFSFMAPDKKDGGTYRAILKARDPAGALTTTIGDKGANVHDLACKPRRDYTFYYHWIGPNHLPHAIEEAVIIEIPELGLSQSAPISVGIDPGIATVQRKNGGPIYPFMLEPLNVYVKDYFHPDVDLPALLKKFSAQTSVTMELASYVPPPIFNPKEKEFFSGLLDHFQGRFGERNYLVSEIEACDLKKEGSRYLLYQFSLADRRLWYPGVSMWERGSYQFKVIADFGPLDACLVNNSMHTAALQVTEYSGMMEETMHTVLIPTMKFAFTLAGGVIGKTSAALLNSLDVSERMHKGDYKGAFVTSLGMISGEISGLPADKLKELIARSRGIAVGSVTASMIKSVQNSADLNGVAAMGMNIVEMIGPQAQAYYDRPGIEEMVMPMLYADGSANKMNIMNLLLEGFKDYYVVVIEKKGIRSYSAYGPGKVKLKANSKGMFSIDGPGQVIMEGGRYVVIPMKLGDRMRLDVSGTGASGAIRFITPYSQTVHEYPSKAWTSTLLIDGIGTAQCSGDNLISASRPMNQSDIMIRTGEMYINRAMNFVEDEIIAPVIDFQDKAYAFIQSFLAQGEAALSEGEVIKASIVARAATASRYPLGEWGYVRNWMALGPFAGSRQGGMSSAWNTDFLEVYGGEIAARLTSGDGMKYTFSKEKDIWMNPPTGVQIFSPKKIAAGDYAVNIGQFFQPDQFVCAYAWCEIESPIDRPCRILYGCDDALRVILNGQIIADSYSEHAVVPDQYQVVGHLSKGTNFLLVKSVQVHGGWLFCLRLVDMNYQALTDCQVVLR